MALGSKQLVINLEALTEQEIEEGLEAGVWDDPATRPMVQGYLDHIRSSRLRASVAEQLEGTQTQAAEDEVRIAKLRASAALIIAAGAMLAAIVSAFIAFLALGDLTISW